MTSTDPYIWEDFGKTVATEGAIAREAVVLDSMEACRISVFTTASLAKVKRGFAKMPAKVVPTMVNTKPTWSGRIPGKVHWILG